MKKALICSHERSGCHLLISTIWRNFIEYDSVAKWEDLDDPKVTYCLPEEMETALTHEYEPAILKSHHPYEFFEPAWDTVLENYHVFYLARDGRDVMTSFWRFLHHYSGLGPRTFNVGQFMEARPTGHLERYNGDPYPETMIGRWWDHVKSWMETEIPGVCYLTYEKLLNDFDGQVEKIANHLQQPVPKTINKPGMVGINPWKGKIGTYKEYFKPNWSDAVSQHAGDECFFWAVAESAMKLLGIGRNA